MTGNKKYLFDELTKLSQDDLEKLARMLRVRSLNMSSIAAALMTVATSRNARMPPVTQYLPTFTEFAGETDADDILGEGSYGIVYRTSKANAVKEIRIDKFDVIEPTVMEYLRINDSMPHPNIATANYVFLSDNTAKISMPIATADLKARFPNGIDKTLRPSIYFQLLRGLAYMHGKDVWHLDLKPENCLVFQEEKNATNDVPNVKISDFGLVKLNGKVMSGPNNIVTWPWRAPELLLGEEEYTELVDVWSIGKMLLDDIDPKSINWKVSNENTFIEQIVFRIGRPTDPKYISALDNGGYNETFVNNDDSELFLLENSLKRKRLFDPIEYDLLSKLLAWPDKRISAYEALQHPYFDAVRVPTPEIPDPQTKHWAIGDYFRPTVTTTDSQSIEHVRSMSFGWMYEVAKQYSIPIYALLYSYTLMDYILTELYSTVFTVERNIQKFEQFKNHRKQTGKSEPTPNKFQWVQAYNVVALWIAAELYGLYGPDLNQAVFISDNIYTIEDLKYVKSTILTHFEFKLSFPTVGEHLRRLIDDKKTSFDRQDLCFLISAKLMTTNRYFADYRNTNDQLQSVAIQAILESGCTVHSDLSDIVSTSPSSLQPLQSNITPDDFESIKGINKLDSAILRLTSEIDKRESTASVTTASDISVINQPVLNNDQQSQPVLTKNQKRRNRRKQKAHMNVI